MTDPEASRLHRTLPFGQAVEEAAALFTASLSDPSRSEELDRLEDCVYAKTQDGLIVAVNRPYRDLFLVGQSPLGRDAAAYLSRTLARVAHAADEVLIRGARFVEFSHVGEAGDGRVYEFLTHKRTLRDPAHPGALIFGLSRPVAIRPPDGRTGPMDYEAMYQTLKDFDDVDLTICRRVCLGDTNQALSEELGLTTRAIEMRRQKMLHQLRLANTVELVKLLVRLQDRGYLDLGI